MARTQDLKLYRRDTRILRISVVDAAAAVVDLTGAMVRWWLAKNDDSNGANVLILKSSETGGGIAIDPVPTTGIVEVAIGRGELNMEPGIYYHQLTVFKGSDTSAAMVGAVLITDTLDMSAMPTLDGADTAIGSPELGTPVLTVV